MKTKVKKIIKKIIKSTFLYQYIRWVHFLYIRQQRQFNFLRDLDGYKSLLKSRVYMGKTRFIKILEEAELRKIGEGSQFFYYSIDVYKTTQAIGRLYSNLSIDYGKVIDKSLEEISYTCNDSEKRIIRVIREYGVRIADYLDKSCNPNYYINSASFRNIWDKKASGFQDALQRILFVNQILWQYGHRLVGLGRLDKVLYKYYFNDISNGVISKSTAMQMISEFLRALHDYYWYKGDKLSGDTGQIIILGGLNSEDDFECNELSELFIECLAKLNIPDPKILLRVSSKMPRELLEKAVHCVSTGCGSPLFANDDIIIPALQKYGYDYYDSYNYVTSACWEPTVCGKSSDQNNSEKINYALPLTKVIEHKSEVVDYESLKRLYFKELQLYIENKIRELSNKEYQEAPLISIFTERTCSEDVNRNSAIYHYYGLTTVGLSNVVNSLFIIHEICFVKKLLTVNELFEICIDNYNDDKGVLSQISELKRQGWGSDNVFVIELANEIINACSEIVIKEQQKYDMRIKIGLSSPDYIEEGKKTMATPDGRKDREPLGVHISSLNGNAYTTIIQFASGLITNGININGNVVDLMVSPAFIQKNFKKFVDFIMCSISVGFYEMQMNVVSSKNLIAAKAEPQKYQNLIVRVWGFSAYFVELPESYQDLLIKRAIANESTC